MITNKNDKNTIVQDKLLETNPTSQLVVILNANFIEVTNFVSVVKVLFLISIEDLQPKWSALMKPLLNSDTFHLEDSHNLFEVYHQLLGKNINHLQYPK